MPKLARLKACAAMLWPSLCALCGGSGRSAVCRRCEERLYTPCTRCVRCGLVLHLPADAQLQYCGRCSTKPPSFDLTLVSTHYEAPVDHLVQSLKFHANLALAPVFARQLLKTLNGTALDPSTLVLPVPLSAQRLTERGFNQALEIAKPLARARGLALATGVCVRVKDTAPQAGLSAAQRQVNVRAAFALSQPRAVLGRSVIVVDDVMTTGHTLQSLAACLKRHGALSVLNLVFARTPQR